MKKILAVSGGVDSMVMLDLMKREFFVDELVVATFDHGTRESAKADVEFVSENCGLKIYKGVAELGAGASEEGARKKRYEFLREVAFEEKGEIWTAHHLDDLVETVVINFLRGTGVRGLAALNASGVRRPFLDGTFGKVFDKRKILEYAAKREVVFRQDPTNASDEYLRNRVRPKVLEMSWAEKMKIYELWQKQKQIMREIDELIENLLPEDLRLERAWFREMPDEVAMEMLRAALMRAGVSATRPQTMNFLKAIREYAPGKKFNLPGDRLVRMGRKDFMLKVC
ncbi:tRNA lysidine(34) synthetase TilS [Candidatus Saccharibacteria bacterium]|nr:tRNA lysidine(34) synthetase TilS [Candidatus Saccharibacteria bacterium]